MSPTTQLLVTSLASSAFGFAAGWFAARVGRDVSEHGGAVGAKWFDRAKTLFGILLVVMAFYSVYEVKQATSVLNRVTTCQTQWNQAFNAGLRERTEAAATEREANQIRWALILEALRNPIPNPTPQQREQLTQRWLNDLNRADRLLAEADAQRAANPVPPPPDCDE